MGRHGTTTTRSRKHRGGSSSGGGVRPGTPLGASGRAPCVRRPVGGSGACIWEGDVGIRGVVGGVVEGESCGEHADSACL